MAAAPWWKLFLTVLLFSGMVKLVILGVGEGLSRLRLAERWRVFRRALNPGQTRREALAALIVVGVDAVLIALFRYFQGPRMAPFSLQASLLTFAWLFVGFEVWFYVSHRLLHTRLLYPLHAQHHVAQVTQPLTSLSFSIAERVILLGGNFGLLVLAMEFMPVTLAGVFGYILFNYTFNVVGHGNTEWLPTRFVSSWAGRVFFTPTFHALHHARYQGHYGLYTVLLDRWLGTAFEDYEQVHARARSGEGLTRIGERLPAAPGAVTPPALAPSSPGQAA